MSSMVHISTGIIAERDTDIVPRRIEQRLKLRLTPLAAHRGAKTQVRQQIMIQFSSSVATTSAINRPKADFGSR